MGIPRGVPLSFGVSRRDEGWLPATEGIMKQIVDCKERGVMIRDEEANSMLQDFEIR